MVYYSNAIAQETNEVMGQDYSVAMVKVALKDSHWNDVELRFQDGQVIIDQNIFDEGIPEDEFLRIASRYMSWYNAGIDVEVDVPYADPNYASAWGQAFREAEGIAEPLIKAGDLETLVRSLKAMVK